MKEQLKKIFPAPAKSFHVRLDAVTNKLNNLTLQVKSLQDEMKVSEAHQAEFLAVRAQQETALDMLRTLSDGYLDVRNELESLRQETRTKEDLLVRALDAFGRSIDTLNDAIASVREDVVTVRAELEAVRRDVRTGVDEIRAVRRELPFKREFYDLEGERKFYMDAFPAGIWKEPDYINRFMKLIKGMDTESVATVVRALKRQKLLFTTNDKKLDVFSFEEQQEIRNVNNDFDTNIFQIGDELFCYKGYLLPLRSFEVCVFYYGYLLDTFKTLDSIKNKDIIDAGAFIGDSALLFSPLTSKKVYAFEAAPENFEYMLKTIELNGLENVVAENLAVSSTSGEIQFHICKSKNSSTSYVLAGMNTNNDYYIERITVPAVSIDEYVEQYGLDVGFIKIDVEGAEQDCLHGAMKTIREKRPALLISIYHKAEDFFNIKPMLEELDLGYKFKIRQPKIGNAYSGIIETLLFAEVI